MSAKTYVDLKRTALYRHFSASGDLLYVGISLNPPKRFSQHSERSMWWDLTTRVDIEWFDSRREALAAERAAIKTENPAFNVCHRRATKQEPVFFHTFKDGRINFQGHVVDRLPDGRVRAQLYSWLTGCPTDEKVLPECEIVEYPSHREWMAAGDRAFDEQQRALAVEMVEVSCDA